ncbi:glycoside hydrolase family 28 protein [Calocera viscosa TUFC12733]|uniref:galacturonan 1,4-alpha-galacturonidase n=1 Tax=Calocera viscosa (strain TUFC12733) TaxID=1330018 RepID=A0A167JYD3_CALVF|nr:glycoside hydrolase family 28 protein [Calocera viscosa TUFC12733]
MLAFAYLLLGASLAAAKTCTVPISPPTVDSTANVLAAARSCSENATIVFSPNATYLLEHPVQLNLTNVIVELNGNLSLPENITLVATNTSNNQNDTSWIVFNGANITFQGSNSSSGGWINGNGQGWWDINLQKGRPHLIGWFLKAIFSGGVVRDLKIQKPIAWVFFMIANNTLAENNWIDARTSTPGTFPFNTDGFLVQGQNFTIHNNVVYNGDDCVTVREGTSGVTVTHNYCANGHGLSIGSLGSNPSYLSNASDCYFSDNTMVNSLYGARFKSFLGGRGSATNVTYRNMFLSNVTFPIYLTQAYYDQGSGLNGTASSNSVVTISDFTYENFFGDINNLHPGDLSCVSDPCWYFEPNVTTLESVIIDLAAGSFKNVSFSNIRVSPQPPYSLYDQRVKCDPSTAIGQNLGIVCQDGPLVTTTL